MSGPASDTAHRASSAKPKLVATEGPSSLPERYLMLDNLIDGCQIVSFDFRYLYVNKAVVKQGRHSKNELLGHTMMEVYPGIEKTEMFGYIKRCLARRRLYTMENEFEFADGSKGWFELRMEPVPEGVVIFSADISKRKSYEEAVRIRNRKLEELNRAQEKAKKALLEAVANLKRAKDEVSLERIKDRAILENIGEGLIAIGPDGKIMMVNRAAGALLGRPPSTLRGKPMGSLPLLDAAGRRVPVRRRPIYLALKHGAATGPSFGEYAFARLDNTHFPIDITTTPIRSAGRVIGAIEVFRDISKEQEIDKAKTEFVSIASHQLRTPLGIAKWYLEAIEVDGYLAKLPRAGRDYFRQIYKSNERVLGVVRDLLSVSRIDQGHIKDSPAPTDVTHLVQATVEEMGIAAARKHIKLKLAAKPAAAVMLDVDPLRLHEVIQNLIANALEYTPAGGRVEVAMHRRAGTLSISISDTGMGIAKPDQKKLFTKFFRSEQAAARNADGSGLGLYIVKSYIKDWGGSIAVRSREGHGSTFTVQLPIKGVPKHAENTNH